MALSNVTAEGVKRAIAEFDLKGREAFLDKYGFGEARGYFLIHGERRYDSKAIVGVAHRYDRPDCGPLKSGQFSGGAATVVPLLESLGFDVARPSDTPSWADEELILALDLYLCSGLLGDADTEVLHLTRTLNDLMIHSKGPSPNRFCDPSHVAVKLKDFAALDPNYDGPELPPAGRREVYVWQRYASDEDTLADAAKAIREGREPSVVRPDEAASPGFIVVEVEAQHVEQFRVSVPRQDREATRREQSLVLKYRDHLEGLGHRVSRHMYPQHESGPALASDLVDETENVLYEAKGNVRRESVRMAIGQLFDYRRAYDRPEQPPMRLAILLPRKPSRDMIHLINSIPASVVWRIESGFACSTPVADDIESLGGTEVYRDK